jgi:hypothetical protein
MNDDLTFLEERLAGYTDYSDVDLRTLNEERARAFAGERLAAVRDRLVKEFNEAALAVLDAAIWQCQFVDMEYARILQDAALDEQAIAALFKIDRRLVEAAERIDKVAIAELAPLLAEIAAAFKARRAVVEPNVAVPASG